MRLASWKWAATLVRLASEETSAVSSTRYSRKALSSLLAYSNAASVLACMGQSFTVEEPIRRLVTMIGLNQGRCQGPRQAGAARPALIVTTGRMAPGSVAEGG